jgi:hypothetical protein
LSLLGVLAAVLYAYLGYPLLIGLLALVRPGTSAPRSTTPTCLRDRADRRVQRGGGDRQQVRCLALDYPSDRLDILIASDGSSDATPDLVRRYADRNVRLLDYAVRRGKAAVLNAAFPEAEGDIVVLSDASTRIEPSAVRKLVRWFRDRRLASSVAGSSWWTRAPGATSMACTGSTRRSSRARGPARRAARGQRRIYAICRTLHSHPGDTIVDDFVPAAGEVADRLRDRVRPRGGGPRETPRGSA